VSGSGAVSRYDQLECERSVVLESGGHGMEQYAGVAEIGQIEE